MTTAGPSMQGRCDLEPRRRLSGGDLRQGRKGVASEWLLTNGIGGYASGTVAGPLARRYHGVLVAALPAPLGRVVMVSALSERVRLESGRVEWLTGGDLAGTDAEHGAWLVGFTLDRGLPEWEFALPESGVLRKCLCLVQGQNSVLVRYRFSGPGQVRLGLRPFLSPRGHEGPVSQDLVQPLESAMHADGLELRFDAPLPALQIRFAGPGQAFTWQPTLAPAVHYAIEDARGYDHAGGLWSPGYIRADLTDGESATVLISTEGWATTSALTADDIEAAERDRRSHLLARAACPVDDAVFAELVLAADQFIVSPSWRTRDLARARAVGLEARSIVAGYHWFTDWGRDTMISLEGLTLATGRATEAAAILHNFAQHMRQGLIPNLFPEGDQTGLYHTADATLWMFHAVHRYVRATGDTALLAHLMPALAGSIRAHVDGTAFTIRVDPADGLLSQGEEDVQLTWMDAKVDGWVVTPRRGKAVEINALWYNALRLMAGWAAAGIGDRPAGEYEAQADRTASAFNERFWNAAEDCLLDVVDGPHGDDAAVRPNQLLAISLDHPVLRRDRWSRVLEVMTARLLTPVGLRSLAPGHRDFQPRYDGDLRSRDAAYHQGTVWAWLIGPYVDAWLKVHPGRASEARDLLRGLVAHLGEAGLGSISEIFDAQAPYTPRGCIAQAWSVAELLRLWRATAAEQETHA